jgi:hypothetical protein
MIASVPQVTHALPVHSAPVVIRIRKSTAMQASIAKQPLCPIFDPLPDFPKAHSKNCLNVIVKPFNSFQ